MNGQLQRNLSFWNWHAGPIKSRHLIGALGIASICAVAAWWGLWRSSDSILPYQPADRAVVERMFQDNQYLLLDEHSTHFSLDRMLEQRAPSYEYPPQSLTIMVYHLEGKPVGFITYHRKTVLEGRIQFLVVDKNMRGRGVGRKLMQYAMNALAAQGYQYVILSVRAANDSAFRLYQSLGFEELSRSDGFVQMSKPLRTPKSESAPQVDW